ncbi:nicotinate phosphoribosyltransferase [Patescibacteria group bacterium]|nr:nicotinate phosphoribosyltransferase [Patescibacteria group bacterium]
MNTRISSPDALTSILLQTDGYKPSHWKQYPAGTTHVFSFLESRGGDFEASTFFGLQYLLKEYLVGVRVTEAQIVAARDFYREYFGTDAIFNEAGWRHILDVHGGRLPVEIRAIPEGTRIPVHNSLMTIVNTDPAVPWLTNYLETLLSQVWYPTTIATQSRAMKDVIAASLARTGDPSLIPFKLHDFGFRGSTSVESSALGGAAHLLNFMGTDTVSALVMLKRFYGAAMSGFSIPAAEHSTITSWGREHEVDAFRNMLTAFPTGLVAVVSDSYDIFHACEELWGRELREQVLARDGVLVVRPDSGDPATVVVKVLNLLGSRFGFTTNAKGFKVLDPHVRVIQGDGIDRNSLGTILAATEAAGWSTDNIAFGSGGGLLQKVNRDTMKFAFKCSAICIDGQWRNVMKDPITDPGKRSKAGRLMLMRHEDTFRTFRYETELAGNLLVPVFRDGELLNEQSLDAIRERAAR